MEGSTRELVAFLRSEIPTQTYGAGFGAVERTTATVAPKRIGADRSSLNEAGEPFKPSAVALAMMEKGGLIMRSYALAIATAGLFALPPSAVSQGGELGTGGIRIDPCYATTMAGLSTAAAEANVGNCGSRALTRRSSASKARAIAADIAKF